MATQTFKQQFPLLARHEGVWDGFYRYYDADGNKTDEHRSRLLCRFPDSGEYGYHQTNYYSWADGRTDLRDFPANADATGEKIVFDSELIDGWAADVKLDTAARTTMLYWERRNEPGIYLYEMIQISDDGQSRSRTWHWYRAGVLFQRTLVDEKKVSSNWRAINGPSYAGELIPG